MTTRFPVVVVPEIVAVSVDKVLGLRVMSPMPLVLVGGSCHTVGTYLN